MRSLTEATLYPGIGLLETTNLSVGRGTDTPFEIIGAPWLDGQKLAAYLNARRLPGVRFLPITFKPNASVFKNEDCRGKYCDRRPRQISAAAHLNRDRRRLAFPIRHRVEGRQLFAPPGQFRRARAVKAWRER